MTDLQEVARPAPVVTEDNRFYWDAAREGRLVAQRCSRCSRLRHPPRPMCPHCHSLQFDIIDLAGGTGPLVERAHAHGEARHPLQALHLTDIVLAQSPGDAAALRVKRAALEQLLAASGRENHSEVQWLEQEIKTTTAEEDR